MIYPPVMPTVRKCDHCGRAYDTCFADPKGCGTTPAKDAPATEKQGWVEVCTRCNYAVDYCGCRKG